MRYIDVAAIVLTVAIITLAYWLSLEVGAVVTTILFLIGYAVKRDREDKQNREADNG